MRVRGLSLEREPFPFNWVPLREGTYPDLIDTTYIIYGFHSIGFPCERGPPLRDVTVSPSLRVSIQLGSPARGD